MTINDYKVWLKSECIDVNQLKVRINDCLFMDFEVGCYLNPDNTWTFYHCGERGEIYKEICAESRAFDLLKESTEVKVVEYEYYKTKEFLRHIKVELLNHAISVKELDDLKDLANSCCRYKIGRGFALFKIIDGKEVQQSDFFQEEKQSVIDLVRKYRRGDFI